MRLAASGGWIVGLDPDQSGSGSGSGLGLGLGLGLGFRFGFRFDLEPDLIDLDLVGRGTPLILYQNHAARLTPNSVQTEVANQHSKRPRIPQGSSGFGEPCGRRVFASIAANGLLKNPSL